MSTYGRCYAIGNLGAAYHHTGWLTGTHEPIRAISATYGLSPFGAITSGLVVVVIVVVAGGGAGGEQ